MTTKSVPQKRITTLNTYACNNCQNNESKTENCQEKKINHN